LALPSDGARQSPRGESDPPAATFGPFGHGGALELAEAEEARLFGRYFLFLRGSCAGSAKVVPEGPVPVIWNMTGSSRVG
jgi:hypothetical protein